MLLALQQLASTVFMGLISQHHKTYGMKRRQSLFLSRLAIRDDSKPTEADPNSHIKFLVSLIFNG